MATLNGHRVTDLHLSIPPAGGWYAELHLDGDAVAAGPALLQVGDLQLQGTILAGRGGLDAPAHPAIVMRGGAGWDTPLPAPGGSFASTNGVKLSTILAALAGVSLEPYDAPAEAILGPAYGWDASTERKPATGALVLAELVSRGALPRWRVTPAGRTSFTAWPTLPAADAAGVVESRGLAHGVRDVALAESVRAWLPGATVQGVRIARCEFTERDSELRAKIWTA